MNPRVYKLVNAAERMALKVPLLASAANTDESRYSDYSKYSIQNKRFINIGAGLFWHRYWTNVDYATDWYAGHQKHNFVNYDLTKCAPLPFESNSIEIAYTSHTIEHVHNDAVENLFREAYRTLVPGGVFRITCPDADLFWRTIVLRQRAYWKWREPWFSAAGAAPETVTTEDFVVREIATERSPYVPIGGHKVSGAEAAAQARQRDASAFFDWLVEPCVFRPEAPGYHINWWTYEKCMLLLDMAGFKTIYRSSRGSSLAPPLQNLRHFDSTFPQMSLYVEAVKT
jgi:SAM-dependent methyltransferase